jgi:threonine aldolase
MDEFEFSAFLKSIGVLANASLPYTVRMVTHHDVTSCDIDEAVSRMRDALKK